MSLSSIHSNQSHRNSHNSTTSAFIENTESNKNFAGFTIEEFEKNGITALQDYKKNSESSFSFWCKTAFDEIKKFASFRITQAVIDTVTIIHGRCTKEPFIAKMDEMLEQIMERFSTNKHEKYENFDAKVYMDSMDFLVLGSIELPKAPLDALNRLLVSLCCKEMDVTTLIPLTKEFEQNFKYDLINYNLSSELVNKIQHGNGVLTPKILLLTIILDLKQHKQGSEKIYQHIATRCLKTVEFYNKRCAFSLYENSLTLLNMEEALLQIQKTTFEKFRDVLNVSTDFLLDTIPYLYIFLVANLLIDRQAPTPYLTEQFRLFLLVNNTLSAQSIENIVPFASNYFSKTKVDNSLMKIGNLLPTTSALLLYIFSTTRLGVNLLSPEKRDTYIHTAMHALLETYKKNQNKVTENAPKPKLETTVFNEEHETKLLTTSARNDLQKQANDSEPKNFTTAQNIQITGMNMNIIINDNESIPLPKAIADMEKLNLKPSQIIFQVVNNLEGAKPSKIERGYQIFEQSLIIVRSAENFALELKDLLPDIPARDWIYDHFILRMLIPLAIVENKGNVDFMARHCEKDRINNCLCKMMKGEELSAKEEDFLLGVIDTSGNTKLRTESSYGRRKIINQLLTKVLSAFHLTAMVTMITQSLITKDGKTWFESVFSTDESLLLYQMAYLPIFMLLNMLLFTIVHGKEASKYYWHSITNIFGRMIAIAPGLPLWSIGATFYDTLATLIDSAGTTGHDQSTYVGFKKATMEGNINKATDLLKLHELAPDLWNETFNSNNIATTPLTEQYANDFASYMSARSNCVQEDLNIFTKKDIHEKLSKAGIRDLF